MKKGTPEWRAYIGERSKKMWADKRAAKEAAQKEAEQIANSIDYKKLYEETVKEKQAAESKLAEYENIIKAFAERERKATETLKKATLEYNALTNYMMDCVKHAYLSLQFAANTFENKEEK